MYDYLNNTLFFLRKEATVDNFRERQNRSELNYWLNTCDDKMNFQQIIIC